MPVNNQVPELLLHGFDSMAQGIQRYRQNKKQDALVTGQLEAMLGNPQSPAVQGLSEGGQKLLSKFVEHKASTKDKMTLLGEAQTAAAQKQQQMQQQEQEMKLQQMQQQQAAIQRLQQMSQFQQTGGRGMGALSPQSFQRLQQMSQNPMMQQAAQIAQATGQAPSPDAMMEYQQRAAAAAGDQKPTPEEIKLPGGSRVAFSRGTGGFSVLPETPQEAGDKEAARIEADTSVKNAATVVADITDTAEDARHTVNTVDRILSLYDQGVQSGFAQPLLTQGRAALGRFGIGQKSLANQQEFENAMQNLVLERSTKLLKGQGAVSNFEREMIQKASANTNLSPDANKAILKVLKNVAERSIQLDNIRLELAKAGKSQREIAQAIGEARVKMPIGLEILDSLPEVGGAKAATEPLKILSIKPL